MLRAGEAMIPSERSRPPIPSVATVRFHGETQDAHSVTRLNLSWIVQLRWAAAVGQAATIAFVHWGMGIHLPIFPLALIIATGAASNLFCALWLKKKPPLADWMLGTVMAVDLCLFTGVLFFTGGPFNPFSSLYLVHLALAAIVLPPRWTWTLVALAVIGNAALFFEHIPLPIDHGGEGHIHDSGAMHGSSGEPLSLHLRGMWVAFGVTAGFIVYFLYRVNRALAQRDAELAQIRDQTERSARLASVATLAAGAAHELATPLSTIAIIAKELERPRSADAMARDLNLIRREVGRCRDILGQMAGSAGESRGEAIAPVRAHLVVSEALDGLPEASRIDVQWSPETRDDEIVVPLRAVAQALRGVLKNALDASPVDGPVVLRVEQDARGWHFQVLDEGEGMSEEVVARATEPFFTTKDTGQGMGLGLFLAQSVLTFLGGTLEIESMRARGTRVCLHLPATIDRTATSRVAETI